MHKAGNIREAAIDEEVPQAEPLRAGADEKAAEREEHRQDGRAEQADDDVARVGPAEHDVRFVPEDDADRERQAQEIGTRREALERIQPRSDRGHGYFHAVGVEAAGGG